MESEGGSLLRKLLERDHAAPFETLKALDGIDVSGAFCPEAVLEAFTAFFQRLEASTSHTGGTRDRELASAVALICGRYAKWGVTDLLRGRSTAVLGYCRVQAEAAALVHLFLREPGKAQEWFDAKGKASKRFYRENQPALTAIMAEHDGLAYAYDRGSEEAMHVRPWILARAYDLNRTEDSRVRLQLLDNELRDDDPYVFLYVASLFFCAQARILHALWRGFPEIDQSRFPELVTLAQFATEFDAALGRKYPERYREGSDSVKG